MGTITALDDDAIEHLLRTARVGRIACADARVSARPYLVPIAYGYADGCVYCVSGPGRKIELMRGQPLVSFEADELQAEDRWASVIAEGEYEELVTRNERDAAVALMESQGLRPEVTPETIVYRIRLTAVSGRREVPDPVCACAD